ncbi:lysosome-associated membrane glycoprotein 2 isoform X3 [Podarcis raffonei]|uniref:lysosome-associated membrane glycoprotein 2 isoform X3 n=1 Tax=Podarcis raffonei TaxID=65483 RepID=UPI0023299A50|nr:lysosome-associated membrane glycoprotein 2 isoform X3 [Podarcis raffonei]
METQRSAAGRLPRALFCALVLFLLEGSVVYQAYAVDVEVKDASNETCLFGKWIMNFSITYETEHNEYKNTVLTFPEHVRYDGSSCDNEISGPVLAIEFGEGHSWNISFTKTNDTYQGIISFTYNTNDTALFPDAKMKGLITTSTNYPLHPVELDTVFICQNVDFVESGSVIQNFQNVVLEAFLPSGNLSDQKTVCDKDAVVTPEPAVPDTSSTDTTSITNTTFIINTTSITNTNTNTNTNTTSITNDTTEESNTTILSSRSISQPDEIPATGTYSVKNDAEICLLATMGLQLNMTNTPMNINPNTTTASGRCGNRSSVLTLTDTDIVVVFTFAVKNTSFERFYLKAVDVTVTNPVNGTQFAASDNLTFWEASLGSSYMCRKKETLVVTPSCSLHVFNLRIQPFQVQNGQFSIAEECTSSDFLFIIPIVVGVVIGLLIVFAFVFYMIGRRKSDSGYQAV